MKIMVLADGETYSGVDGCKILDIQDDLTPEEINHVLKAVKIKKGMLASGYTKAEADANMKSFEDLVKYIAEF